MWKQNLLAVSILLLCFYHFTHPTFQQQDLQQYQTLFSFNGNSTSPWVFNNGGEFPGAIGSLQSLQPNGARISFNLTQGAYVAAYYTFPARNFTYLSFRVKFSCGNNMKVSIRLTDSSGQTLQYGSLTRLFEDMESVDSWLDFFVSTNKPSSYWGGQADGIPKRPFTKIGILAELLEKKVEVISCLDFDRFVVWNETSLKLDLDSNNSKLIPVKKPFNFVSRLGVNIHFTSDDKALNIIKSAGFSWIRYDFKWGAVESTKGVYDFTNYDKLYSSLSQRGLKPLFIFGYSNTLYTESYAPVNETALAGYCNFCRQAVRHFKGKDIIWEIYNEAIVARWQFTGQTYGILARAAVQAIHDEDPTAIVTTSGLGGMDYAFLRGYVNEMGITSTNGIGLHPYGIGIPSYPNGRMTDNLLRFRSIVTQYLNDTSGNYTIPPVFDTEWGITATDFDTNTTKNGLSPIALKGQANQAVQSLLSACAVEFPIVIYYDLRNDGTDPSDREHNFGLLFNNYTDKPAMTGVRMLTSQISNRTYEGLLSTKPSPLVAMKFSGENDTLVVIWSGEFKTSLIVSAVNATGVWDIYGNEVSVLNGVFSISDEDGVMYIKYPKKNVIIQPASSPISPKPSISNQIQRNASSSNPTVANSKRVVALSSASIHNLSLFTLTLLIATFFFQ